MKRYPAYTLSELLNEDALLLQHTAILRLGGDD